ncbi:SCO3374 family protein [Streptomyces lushanensis]|uniref:SCO3374 family protein n=1 Tax=Streptomyces lushanensis TaxID=1434255 RepID=UPI000B1AEBA1|nr:SCO3374 family protein [Streptomyces lushanensis]
MAFTVPPPRGPREHGPVASGGAVDATTADGSAADSSITDGPFDGGPARWYEDELGWATEAGPPLLLPTGLRFDVLELPADAGAAVLRRIGPTGPVALLGGRMGLLVAEGSAEELPGLLGWLEWGGIALGLTALGAGGRITAPAPPRWTGCSAQGAAMWLRPPEPGLDTESTLPALALRGRGIGNGGSGGGAPDLVRLVDAAATECHRARLSRTSRGNTPRTNTQPLAFS